MDNDPRAEHILAHPYFIRGAKQERQGIIEQLEDLAKNLRDAEAKHHARGVELAIHLITNKAL